MPPTTTPHQAITSRRAKAQFRKSGPQLAPSEQRRLARAAELDTRAQAIKERDERKRQAEKTKVERDKREKDARRKTGVGLATQLAGYSVTQKVMKGGMEGWLGVGNTKRKRDDTPEKENALQDVGEESSKGLLPAKSAADSFGSNAEFDQILLDHLDSQEMMAETEDNTAPRNVSQKDSEEAKIVRTTPVVDVLPKQSSSGTNEYDFSDFPTAKRVRTEPLPQESFSQYISDNTQITKELSQNSPEPPRIVNASTSFAFPSTQDFGLNSDDWFEAETTAQNLGDAKDGILVRDFAEFKHDQDTDAKRNPPNAPKLPRNYSSSQSMRRSFGRKPTIVAPAQKMTANCAEFSVEQRSFTSKYHEYGLSTQILLQAIEDDGSDTEEEDEEVYSQAIAAARVPDHVRMPPPPPKISPPMRKQQASSDGLFGNDKPFGLGLSTQDPSDVVEDDEFGGLFNVALKRPSLAQEQTIKPSTLNSPPSPLKERKGYHEIGPSTQALMESMCGDEELTDDEYGL